LLYGLREALPDRLQAHFSPIGNERSGHRPEIELFSLYNKATDEGIHSEHLLFISDTARVTAFQEIPGSVAILGDPFQHDQRRLHAIFRR
jgi:hypothetical protein